MIRALDVKVIYGPHTADVFDRPQNLHTKLLLASVPRLAASTIPIYDAGNTELLAVLKVEST